VKVATQKIKKNTATKSIDLIPTKDTLAELGKLKTPKQILVGFALETENELKNAILKIKNKNLDLIVLNSLNDAGAGFKTNTNKITIIDKYNNSSNFELKNKSEVALDVLNAIFKFK
jgi:phosphopantothenoylcysteine decarboxylase/phosphopantothenate--cysteine ligase